MKKLFSAVLAVALLFSANACGNSSSTSQEESKVVVDKTKTQIYVSCYTGGFGAKWMDNAVEKFNAKQDDYQVIRLPDNKDDMSSILSKISGLEYGNKGIANLKQN